MFFLIWNNLNFRLFYFYFLFLFFLLSYHRLDNFWFNLLLWFWLFLNFDFFFRGFHWLFLYFWLFRLNNSLRYLLFFFYLLLFLFLLHLPFCLVKAIQPEAYQQLQQVLSLVLIHLRACQVHPFQCLHGPFLYQVRLRGHPLAQVHLYLYP